MLRQGRAAEAQIRELTTRVDALAADYAARDPLGADGRRALFGELADLVDAARILEEQAVPLLRK